MANSQKFFDNEIIMEVEEVADLLKKKPQTIRNWISMRKIPHIPNGNKSVILKSSLMQWLKSKEVKATCQ